MPSPTGNSLKNPELYEKLRQHNDSKQKAARISNAAAAQGASEIGRKGGESPPYEEWTVPELKKRAKELGLTGYSSKTKPQLISALRNG